MAIAIGILIGLVVGIAGVFGGLRLFAGSRLAAARRARQLLLAEARGEADVLRREAQLEAKEEAVKLRSELERDLHARQAEAIKVEQRLSAREGEVERRLVEVTRREQARFRDVMLAAIRNA